MHWSADDLKSLRARLGVTQADFARLLNVDIRTVRRWEAGTVAPAGAAEAVLTGLRLSLERDPSEAEQLIKFLVGAAAIGGLAYLVVKLLEQLPSRR